MNSLIKYKTRKNQFTQLFDWFHVERINMVKVAERDLSFPVAYIPQVDAIFL